MSIVHKAFERGLLLRATGDILALSPPLIATEAELDEMFALLTDVLTKG
jgi:beta-alanine--pyruvate transaminase